MPRNKLEPVEECDYCDGTIQENPGVVVEEKGRTGTGNKVPEKADTTETTGDERKSQGVETVSKKDRVQSPKDKGEGKPEAGRKEVSTVPVQEEQTTLPTAKANEKLATLADKHHQALVQCKKLMGQSMLEFCRHLREIKDKELFKFYAESWYEYLSMPEIALDDTRARRLIRLINVKEAMEKQLGRNINIEEIAEARLTRDLLPCIQYDEETGEVKNVKAAETLLDQARTLGHEDWQAEVEKKKPKIAGKKASEVLIEAGPVTDEKGNIIGQLISVGANEENHYLRIRIANENIPQGALIVKIK
jgi:hypothetical protein